MLGLRRSAFATIFLVVATAGCASIGPSASETPASSAPPSVEAPSAVASTPAAATIKPTKKPRKTNAVATAEATASPTESASVAGPNIAVTGFVSITDRILVGAQSSGRVSLLNDGPLEVGQFYVGVTWVGADGLSQGFSSPVSVGGMVPGQSLDITVDLSLSDPGDVIFTASADTDNVLQESNEEDNTKTLSITAVSLPNLTFGMAEFDITDAGSTPSGIDQNGVPIFSNYWEFTLVVRNAGSVAAPPYSLRAYYYDAAGQIVENPVVPFDESIPAGGQATHEDFLEPVGVGFQADRLYLELDPVNDIEEFDEGDNEASVVPVMTQ
jgi:subtilase family serine protease